MPGCARREIVREGEIGVYHAWSRCVQRAFLCGQDSLTGENYDYRRDWIQKLLEYQASVFAIDLGSYSILQNHEHLIIRTRPDIAARWSDEEVAWRWRLAWPTWNQGVWSREPTDETIRELLDKPKTVAAVRGHLSSLSWFMARCKEPIARLANQETDRRGHFWEQRFGCRELVDEAALLTCSVYVDLNQVKAGAATSLEESDYSAIQDRLRAWRTREARASVEKFHGQEGREYGLEPADVEILLADCWLAPIEDRSVAGAATRVTPSAPVAVASGSENPSTSTPTPEKPVGANTHAEGVGTTKQPSPSQIRPQKTIDRRLRPSKRRRASEDPILAMPWEQYREIVQWAAAQTLARKWRSPPADLAERLRGWGIQPEVWHDAVGHFDSRFHRAVGAAERLAEIVSRTGGRWLHGIRCCRDVFT